MLLSIRPQLNKTVAYVSVKVCLYSVRLLHTSSAKGHLHYVWPRASILYVLANLWCPCQVHKQELLVSLAYAKAGR